VDAPAAITLAAGREWLSETLDVLFGKRDVYPGAVVLPNRSAGDAFATSWTFILCSVVFKEPYSLYNQGYGSSVVTFTKGQPLGFYSSWPLFTLTHHMLVWIAAERVYGTTKLCDYAILGDGDRRREGGGRLP
jgi:hypothetical protein